MPSVMGSVDCGSQTGPEHWLFTNLTELSVLAPHFLPTGWSVVTYSCNEEGLCLGFAHNLYHPQLRRFVCDRAIYISQLSYSVGSGVQSSVEPSITNRFDGFQITCEQYHVGGPTGKKERYESIVFIQYVSELLKIIETLDQKSSTLLYLAETIVDDDDNGDGDGSMVEVSDPDNFHTLQNMFSHKISSRGRTIQLSSKIDDSIGKCPVQFTESSDLNSPAAKILDNPDDAPPKTITISDAEGNVLAHIQDSSLTLETVGFESVEKTDDAKEKAQPPTQDVTPEAESPTGSMVVVNEIADSQAMPKEGGDEIRDTDSSKTNTKSDKPKLKRRKRKNGWKLKTAKDVSSKTDPLVCAEFDFDSVDLKWNCDVCQLKFGESDELATHLNTHPDLKRFRCEVCGLRFTKRHNQTYHVKTVHEGRRNFKCHVCGKAFSKGHDLKRHSMTHETIRQGLVCKYCKKVYYTQQNHDIHVAGHEGDEKGFRWCLICGLKLSYHQHKYHMRKHLGPADCFDCGRTFSNVDILRQHLKMDHFDAATKCSSCEEFFRNKTEWTAHFKATHESTATAIHQCPVCLRTFPSAQQLQMHSAIHVEGKRPHRNKKASSGKKSTNASLGNHVSLDAELLQTPFGTPMEMQMIPSDSSELTSIEVDGQTIFLTRVEALGEGVPLDGVLEGNVNDVFIIPSANVESEGLTIPSNETIWVDGVSPENLAVAMTL